MLADQTIDGIGDRNAKLLAQVVLERQLARYERLEVGIVVETLVHALLETGPPGRAQRWIDIHRRGVRVDVLGLGIERRGSIGGRLGEVEPDFGLCGLDALGGRFARIDGVDAGVLVGRICPIIAFQQWVTLELGIDERVQLEVRELQ